MVAENANLLGIGLYSPYEAALYAQIPLRMMTRWIHGTKSGQPVVRPQLEGRDDKTITFLDFVQALAIRSIRLAKAVPLQRIRDAVETAREKHGIQYPFAVKHKTYVFGNNIIIRIRDDEDIYEQISGHEKGNRMLTEVVELYMQSITFNEEGLAESYTVRELGEYKIIMDPKIRLGEPLVTSCGYTAMALWEACISEGGLERAAKVYGVSTKEVELAYGYYEQIAGTTSLRDPEAKVAV